MKTGVTFAHPNSIFLSEDALSEFDLRVGVPVRVDFENGESIAGKATEMESLDLDKETHAMFFSIPDIYGEVPEKYGYFSSIFKERDEGIGGRSTLDLGEPEVFVRYLETISSMVDKRNVSDSDIVIGNELIRTLDSQPERDAAELIHNQLLQSPKEHFLQILDGDFPEVSEVQRYGGEIKEPSEVYFCTNNMDYSPGNRQGFRKEINGLKYIMPTENFLFPTTEGLGHGPVLERLPEEVELSDEIWESDVPQSLIRVSEDNVRICGVHYGSLHQHSEADKVEIPEESLMNAIFDVCTQADLSPTFCRPLDRSEPCIRFSDGFEIMVSEHPGEAVYFTIRHPNEEELELVEDFLLEVGDELEEALPDMDPLHLYVHQQSPPETAYHENWVLDTNSVYRQKPKGEKTPIDDFLLNVQHIYGKNIVIPIESLVEINRHKDEGDGKSALSRRGVKNISILKEASEFGVIDFEPTELPEQYDNRIHPGTGATDLAIIDAAKTRGIFLSNDQNALTISDALSVPNSDITEMDDIAVSQIEDIAKNEAQNLLSSGSKTKTGLSQELQTILEERREEGNEIEEFESSDIDSIIQRLIDNREVVSVIDEGEIRLHKAQERDVVLTYSAALRIADEATEIDDVDGKYMDIDTLESVRSALGGLNTNTQPYLTFWLPECFIRQADQTNQISDIYKVQQLQNATYKSAETSEAGDLGRAAVELAKDLGVVVLCSREDGEIYKMSNLLGVEAVRVD